MDAKTKVMMIYQYLKFHVDINHLLHVHTATDA